MENAPAEGERRAIKGYHPQYQIITDLIYKGLVNGTLKKIKLVDPTAGSVDDFQIISENRLDAYQIRWQTHPSAFTFNNLCPDLLNELAEGLKKLKRQNTNVKVHLYTNRYPSVNDSVKDSEEKAVPSPNHFSYFLTHFWMEIKNNPENYEDLIPLGWEGVWEKLLSTTRLRVDEFVQFIKDCELDFKQILPGDNSSEFYELYHFLYKEVSLSETGEPLEFTRDELLSKLGWKRYFSLRNQQFYNLAEDYIPDENLIDELNHSISNIANGYIAIMGPPGVGKSSFIANLQNTDKTRIMKYYIHLQDSLSSVTERAESENYLHDILLMIENQGFGRISDRLNKDLHILREDFKRALGALNEVWIKTGIKTVIILDGLDHISRNPSPSYSLVNELLIPENIPDGVIIVLGTQSMNLLSSEIKSHIENYSKRKFVLNNLSKDTVYNLIDRKLELSHREKEMIYENSSGHPLVLKYILNLLISNSSKTYDELISEASRYEGNLDSYYNSYWNTIKNDREKVYVFGIISRLRRYLDKRWFLNSFGVEKFEVIKEFIHFFRIELQNRIYFFHESFREFLYRKTMEFQNDFDLEIDQYYHREIAEKIEGTFLRPVHYELIYHLSKSNQSSKILKVATQDFFRSQFFELRPANGILADINLAIRSIKSLEEIPYLIRFILIGAEIYQRRFNISTHKGQFYNVLIKFKKYEQVLDYCRGENSYYLDKKMRMNICSAFVEEIKSEDELNNDIISQFKALFHHSEPIELFEKDTINSFDQDYIVKWAVAASLFDEPINIIRKLDLIGSKQNKLEYGSDSRNIRNNLILRIIETLYEQQRFLDNTERINIIRNGLNISREEDLPYYLWSLLIEYWKVGSIKENRLNEIMSELKENLVNTHIPNSLRLQIAKELIKAGTDLNEITDRIKDLFIPFNMDISPFDLSKSEYFNELILYIGIKLVLDETILKEEVNSILSQDDDKFIPLFKTAYIIGNLLAMGLKDNQLNPSILNRKITEIFQIFKKYYDSDRYSIHHKETWLDLFKWLIQILRRYFNDLEESWRKCFFKLLFQDDETSDINWSLEFKRELLAFLSEDISNKDVIKEHLISLNTLVDSELDPYELITHHLSLAHIFADLEDISAAEKCFNLVMRHSLGVGNRKDYQLDVFIILLRLLLPYDRKTVFYQSELFNQIIPGLHSYVENNIIHSVSNELLNTAFMINPSYAVGMFKSMISRGIIDYFTGLGSILSAALTKEDFNVNIASRILEYYFIPLDSVVPSELFRNWITRFPIDTIYSNKFKSNLLDKINKYSLPKIRKDWIKEFLTTIANSQCNLSNEQIELLEMYDSERFTLQLKNKDTFTISELLNNIDSPPDIFEFFENQEEGTNFDWDFIIINYSHLFDIDDIKKIIIEFNNNDRILSELIQKYFTEAEFDKVVLLSEAILTNQSKYEWGPLTGGPKNTLNALEILFKINTDNIEEIGIPFITQRISKTTYGPFGSLFFLPEILNPFIPYLGKQLIEECWIEVDEYLMHLLENLERLKGFPEENSVLEEDTPNNAILSILLANLEETNESLQYFSQKIGLALLHENNTLLITLLQKDLEDSSKEHYGKLILLHSFLIKKPEFLTVFKNQLISLYLSNNLRYRSIIHSILEENNEEIPKPDKFDLEKFNRLKSRTDTEIEVGRDIEGMINTSLLKTSIVSLSMDTGISKETLIACLKQLIVEKYSEIAIKDYLHDEIMAHYNNIGLSFYGKKPQFFPVRNAFFELLAILYDSYYLHSGIDNFGYERLFHFYDPLILNFEPVGKAQIIEAVQREDYLDIEKFFDISIPDEYILNKLSDYYILGEFTRYRILERPFPVENRKNFVFFENTIAENDFENITDIPLARYHSYIGDITGRFISNRLILYNKVLFSENEGVNWIAFNPKLARQLKWKKSENGLCRWVNDNNETMVETIWWTDGFFKTAGFHFCDVGEGWLVVASSEALDKIKSLGGLKRKIVLQRYDRDNQREVSRIIDVTE